MAHNLGRIEVHEPRVPTPSTMSAHASAQHSDLAVLCRLPHAQSKQKIIDKMVAKGLTEPVTRESTFRFTFPDCDKLPPPVLPFVDVSFSYSGKKEDYLYSVRPPCTPSSPAPVLGGLCAGAAATHQARSTASCTHMSVTAVRACELDCEPMSVLLSDAAPGVGYRLRLPHRLGRPQRRRWVELHAAQRIAQPARMGVAMLQRTACPWRLASPLLASLRLSRTPYDLGQPSCVQASRRC